MTRPARAVLPVQQRAWDTRVRILEAAVTCLAVDGYAATTTTSIQQRAEVSRGSLLHQFPDKDSLLVAAVQHLAAARTAGLETQGPRTAGRIDTAVETLWSTLHGPLFEATLELWVAARNNTQLAAALAPREHELGHSIRVAVATMFGADLSRRDGFGELASLLLTSMRGAALTYTFEPRDFREDPNLAVWKRLAHVYLD